MIFIAGVVAVLGSYTFLPPVFEGMMGRGIQDRLELESAPAANLESNPAPGILAGEFSQGKVVLEEPDFAGVRAERVAMDLEPFGVDMLGTILAGQIRPDEPLSGKLRVELPEREVERAAMAAVDAPISGVKLEKDRVIIESGVRVLGAEIPVSIEGEPRLRGETLVFRPVRVEALGMEVPERMSRDLLSGARFEYPLRGLPYGAEVTGVRVEENRVVLSGRVERLTLG